MKQMKIIFILFILSYISSGDIKLTVNPPGAIKPFDNVMEDSVYLDKFTKTGLFYKSVNGEQIYVYVVNGNTVFYNLQEKELINTENTNIPYISDIKHIVRGKIDIVIIFYLNGLSIYIP